MDFTILANMTPGGLSYERGGDVRRKFWSKPLKETNLGVAQTFFLTPKHAKQDHFETQTNKKYSISSRATLNETFMAKYSGIFPEHPKWD